MPGYEVDGNDLVAMHEIAREAVERARDGGGPSLIHARLNRFYGHFEGDAMTYRGDGEVEKLRAEADCIQLFRKHVTETGLLDAAQLDAVDAEVTSLIDEAVDEAKAAPPPPAEELLTDVYVSY